MIVRRGKRLRLSGLVVGTRKKGRFKTFVDEEWVVADEMFDVGGY